jgi:secreted trypsin-like serine protease
MIILLVIFIFSIFDVTTSVDYICDRHASCGCSKRQTVIMSKIIGGEPVMTPHSWGWMASLRRDDIHECGASLLTPFYAITAAHCVKDIMSLSRLSLNFGITTLSDIGQLRNVTRMHIHPLYDQELLTNDLAILRLHQPVNLTDSQVSCICLPATSEFDLQLAEYPPIGDNLVAIGWGITDPFIPIPSSILQQVTVQAMARTETACSNIINDDVLQFCAGYPEGGKDTCKGDSGGPLMLFKNSRWQLAGITSYGGICGSPGFAGVYTRIAYYDSFIQEIINSNDTYIQDVKKMDVENKLYSNTETIYEKSMIKLFFICLFIMYKTFFYRN